MSLVREGFRDAIVSLDEDVVNDQINVENFDEGMFREILNRDPEEDDTRSQVVAIRLPNGDLVLGFFPQGDTYEAISHYYLTV